MLTDIPETKISQADKLPETFTDGVSYDSESISLCGLYSDELSAHRAKKIWIEAFTASFLLEEEHDFNITIQRENDKRYLMICHFNTACARYAFWRITNGQAQEVKSLIETAHIPVCDSRREDILHAPDLKSIHDNPYTPARVRKATTLPDILKSLVDKIRNT